LRRMSARLRAPADCGDLALLALRQREQIDLAAKLEPEAVVALLQACDAWRRPARFAQLLQAIESCSAARPFAAAPRLLAALRAARAVDAGAIAARESEAHKIAARLRAARVAAVKSALAAA
jgi:tRNA nucleotidyltransferase (CCA-adding enzyme)